MATSRVDRTAKERKVLLDGLAERGYNGDLIAAAGWDEDGYYMLVLDSKGRRLRDGLGIAKTWQYWDDPERYKFVRDWFEEFVDDQA